MFNDAAASMARVCQPKGILYNKKLLWFGALLDYSSWWLGKSFKLLMSYY